MGVLARLKAGSGVEHAITDDEIETIADIDSMFRKRRMVNYVN